jgi:hypothetical protein
MICDCVREYVTSGTKQRMVAISPLAILVLLIVVVSIVVFSTSRKGSSGGEPSGFPWLALSVGVVLLVGIATLIVYQARPVDYVLEVNVPSGNGFVGEVTIDGRSEIIRGEGQRTFEFTGRRITWAILVVDPTGTDIIEVRLSGGMSGYSSSNWGARGYSEKKFIGGGALFTSINADEWRTGMAQLMNEGEVDSSGGILSAPSNPESVPGADDTQVPPPGSNGLTPDNGNPMDDGEAPASTDKWLRIVIETAYV